MKLYLTIFLLLLSHSAFSRSINELEKRYQTLVFNQSKLERLDINAGRFKMVYDRYLTSDNNLLLEYEAFNQSSLDWLNQWESVFNIYLLRDKIDYHSISSLKRSLRDLLESQRDDLQDLNNQGNKLLVVISQFDEELSSIETLHKENYGSDFTPYIESLNKKVSDLRGIKRELFPVISDRLQEMTVYINRSQNRIVRNLRNILLENSSLPLQSSLEAIDEVFLIEEIANSRYQKNRHHYKKLKSYALDSLYFHAKRELASMEALISDLKLALVENDIIAPYAHDYVRSMENDYRKAEGYILDIEGPLYTIVNNACYYLGEKYSLKISSSEETKVNIPLLTKLSKLGDLAAEDKLREFSDKELEEIEFLWDKVGPLTH